MKDGCHLIEIGYDNFEKFIDMLVGKWKLRILYFLALNSILRYSELKKVLSPITHKMHSFFFNMS